MLTDIFTIIRKELKEVLLMRGSLRSGLFNLLLIVAIGGVLMPLQTGVEWFANPILPLVWAWLPIFLAISLVADAFAGERERHTLETLLASRMSDSAILYGKMGAAVAYSWSIAIASLLLGALSINIAYPQSEVHFYPAATFFGGLVLSLLACLFITGLGTLVSLRAATARQAYQQLSYSLVVLFLVPTLGVRLLPAETLQKVDVFITGLNLTQVFLGAMAVMTVLDVVFFLLARARFQRAKMALD